MNSTLTLHLFLLISGRRCCRKLDMTASVSPHKPQADSQPHGRKLASNVLHRPAPRLRDLPPPGRLSLGFNTPHCQHLRQQGQDHDHNHQKHHQDKAACGGSSAVHHNQSSSSNNNDNHHDYDNHQRRSRTRRNKSKRLLGHLGSTRPARLGVSAGMFGVEGLGIRLAGLQGGGCKVWSSFAWLVRRKLGLLKVVKGIFLGFCVPAYARFKSTRF